MGCRASNDKGEVYGSKCLLENQERFQINNLTLQLQELEKQQTKPKGSKRRKW